MGVGDTHSKSKIPGQSGNVSPSEAEAAADIPPSVDTVAPPDCGGEVSAENTTPIAADVTAQPTTKTSSVHPSIVTPTSTSHSPPPALTDINLESVPAFLRSHGKGKREVNIFNYLNQVQDPRFRQVLLHYIRIESADKSGVDRNLPTAKRPVEISQWSSRARPASVPDFPRGSRTFLGFVDSVFVWWESIQPSWRSFKRGRVSREVGGEWDALQAPRINGLLNVVILVYWWVRILEERRLQDGARSDYEEFADDVAWVFSNLSN
jgi:hypothetical protein